ncbi:alpha/beta hydrolase [Kribbella antibiotica]|uniref:Alpha/beta hydrolase n=1 Tax=Kribbella antibiotica TaxID=190195 RepID=A0A4R4ZI44_9ACTN|nr:alpha/beta hydrolase [Kribbella antibiotica]TDD57384.1 alpha/beta hydrolase [Kribbella antibiotica]
MRHRKTLAIAVTALALVVPDSASAVRGPQINWGTCGPDLQAFQCATVEVPTDYDRPHGPTTTIAVTRLPASDPAHKVGTLFVNFGGPGAAGVASIQQVAQTAYSPELRARFDILGFDPRGVGLSDPATCYPTAAEEAVVLAKLKEFPVTAQQERSYIADAAKMAAHCRTTSPERFKHFSTANVARDLDLLRQAVGDRKLNYLGYSYGTYLAATYAKLFPNKIRAMVMDGTLLPERYVGSKSEDLPFGARLRQGEGGYDSYQQFLLECQKAGDACALNALGDPKVVVEKLLEGLKTKPIGTFDYPAAVGYMFNSFYSSTSYPALAQTLADLVTQPKMRLAKEDYPSIGNAMQPCVETQKTGRPQDYPSYADAADQRAPHFGRYRAWLGIHCEFLGLTDTDAFRGPWRNNVEQPVLVFGTRHDPATPYSTTRPFANLWPDARMVTIEGWGHATSFGASVCADRMLTKYLITLAAPADGSTCQQDRKPFDSLPTAATGHLSGS